ncbi:MAG: hypothetical protein P8182_06245 [Deltaproteobacteria bacterium]
MSTDYTHDLKREVRAISGGYELDTEGKIEVDGREILYAVGNAVVDSSCCGSWGCRYALVPGYVLTWKYRENEEGIPVTRVARITDERVKEQVTKLIEAREQVTQVRFW